MAKASFRGNGLPDGPMVVLPKTELTEYVEPELVRTLARTAMTDILDQLGEGV